MLEQKLFFTRNGEYTLWEKISLNKEENLLKIKDELERVFTRNLNSNQNNIISNIYSFCNSLEGEEINKVKEVIDNFFDSKELEKLDFNALLFKFDSSYLDIDTANKKLEYLDEIIKSYEEELEIYKFLRKEKDIIDIKLKNTKSQYYKGNPNEQTINTELRIYVKLGLIIMTDYSDYTHKRSIKNKLLYDISYLLTKDKYSIKECILTDMTLRMLLKKSKKHASKFKFSIEEFIDVDFNITNLSSDNPLEYEQVRTFYDNYDISLIKISMNSDEDKYITIDGNKGKINSRSKNLEAKDIDEFMILLSEVMEYDYLNNDYLKEVTNIAKIKWVMPTITKKVEVENIYLYLKKKIEEDLNNSFDLDNIKVIANSFFYCLLNNIYPQNISSEKREIDYTILNKLEGLFGLDKENINRLYSDIIYLLQKNEEDILEQLDNYIVCKGVENVN